MDFLQHLETDLTVLAAEAGTKFPEVTEAAKRGVVKVRKMREQYAAAVRLSVGEPPPLSMFRSQDLLRPFLLACNHADAPAKLVSMALGSLQHLIQRDALYPGDCPNVMRVLAIQASTALKNHDGNAQVKVVQTLVMVVNWTSCDMAEETLGQALSVCLNLHRSRTSHVRGAAHMTIRQLVRLMLDRLTEMQQQQQNNSDSSSGASGEMVSSAAAEVGKTPDNHSTKQPQHESAIVRSTRQLLLDLCLLSGGENGVWLKKDLLRREVGLELLEDIFNQKPDLFLPGGIFSEFLSKIVMPMVKNLITADGAIFLHLEARASVLLATIIKNFGTLVELRENLRDILSAPPRYSQRSSSSQGDGERVFLWSVALSMEPIKHIVESPEVMDDFFRIYDLGEEQSENEQEAQPLSTKQQCSFAPVVESLLQGLIPCLSLSLPYIIDSSNSTGSDVGLISERRGGEPLSKTLFHTFEAEYIEKENAPSLPDGEPALTTLHCAASAAHTVAALCIESKDGVAAFSWVEWMTHLPLPQIAATASEYHAEEEVGDSSSSSSSTTTLSYHRKLCEMAWPHLLACFSTVALHSVELPPEMRKLTIQCIGCIALACGSQGIENGLESIFSEYCRFALPFDAAGEAASSSSFFYSRYWETLGCFFSLVHTLSNVMNYMLWVKTFEMLEHLNTACSSVLSTSSLSPFSSSFSNLEEKEVFDAQFSAQEAKDALQRFPSFTSSLSCDSFASALSALASQCTNALALDATHGVGGSFPGIAGSMPLVVPPNLTAPVNLSLVSRVGAAVRSSALSLTRGYSDSVSTPTHQHVYKASQEIGPDNFIIKMTIDCFSENAWRIGNVWDTFIACLRVMVNSNRESLRDLALVSLQDIISNALTHQKGRRAEGGLDVLEARTAPPECHAALPPVGKRTLISSEQLFEDRFTFVFATAPSAIDNETRLSSGAADPSSLVGSSPPLEVRLFASIGHFATAPHVKTREAILKIQDTILQSRGQELTNAWSIVIETLKGVAVAAYFPESPISNEKQKDNEKEEGTIPHHHQHPVLVPWGGNCLLLAFNSLKLIIDDFLDWVPSCDVWKIVSAIGAFGHQSEDINLSLTAVGMLWTVCDYFSGMNSTWNAMFDELQSLSADRRPEVRNCAVHTLFSALTGSGSLDFGVEQWRSYFVNVAFPIIDQVMAKRHAASPSADTAVAPELKKGVRMLMHHSRDTDRKQWDESAVLAFHGIGRVMQSYGRILAPKYEWFATEVWSRSLDCYVKCTELQGLSPEVARAVLEGITILVQVISRGGYTSPSDHVGPGMTVVGGVLQQQKHKVPSKEESSSVTGVVDDADLINTSGGSENCSGAAAAATPNSELDAFTSNSFSIARREMWQAAWKAFHRVAVCLTKMDMDMSQALMKCLVCMYNSSRGKDDWEFGGTLEGERNAEEMLDILDELMIPPTVVSVQNSSAAQVEQQRALASTRKLHREGVRVSSPATLSMSGHQYCRITSTQRAILEFLRTTVDSAWERVLYLLSRCSFSALHEGKLSKACASESASILAELMSNGRVPGQRICTALPPLLMEMMKMPPSQSSTMQWKNGTFLKGGGSATAQYCLLETPPASNALTAQANHLVLILQGALPHLEVGLGGQEKEAWGCIISSMEDMGLSCAHGWLKSPTTPSDNGQQLSTDGSGTEFSNSIQCALILIVKRMEQDPLCQLSMSVQSDAVVDTASRVVQAVLAVTGNTLCSMYGMPPSGELESQIPVIFKRADVIEEAAGILHRATEGSGYWGSKPCIIFRRMALWELIRALYWSLHWHSVVEASLEPLITQNDLDTTTTEFTECGRGGPSLKSELEVVQRSIDSSCLIVLNGVTKVMKDCIFPSDFLTPALAEAVEVMLTSPSKRPTPEEMLATCSAPPASIRKAESKLLSCRRDGKIQEVILPICSRLMERLESRSTMMRVASSRLLTAIDIPQLIKQLKDDNAMLLREIEPFM